MVNAPGLVGVWAGAAGFLAAYSAAIGSDRLGLSGWGLRGLFGSCRVGLFGSNRFELFSSNLVGLTGSDCLRPRGGCSDLI